MGTRGWTLFTSGSLHPTKASEGLLGNPSRKGADKREQMEGVLEQRMEKPRRTCRMGCTSQSWYEGPAARVHSCPVSACNGFAAPATSRLCRGTSRWHRPGTLTWPHVGSTGGRQEGRRGGENADVTPSPHTGHRG